MAAPAAATPSASAGCSVRAKDVFAKGSRLSSRADVRAITSDGEELWLHRMVLEMWSSLFAELCVAAEEAPEADAGSAPAGAPPAVVTIHLSDTAQELLPLLSCLYPTLAGTGAGARAAIDEDGDAAGLSGAKLDASTALPLLRLADKYDIPHVIATAAATMTDHVIPRLAAAPTAAAAASYLQLPLPLAEGGGAAASAEEEEAEAEAGVAEWVVCAVEAATRLGLRELEGAGVELLAAKFYDWGLQACPHLLVRLVHCLPPDALVGGLLCALTPPPPPPPVAHLAGECKDQHGPAASSSSIRLSSRLQQRGYATGLLPHRQPRGRAAAGGRQVAAGEGNGGGAVLAGAMGGGGGPRIVPVVIAAAGPAAAVAGAPPLLGPHHHHHHLNHHNHHNHHQFHNHHNHHQFHNHAAAAGLPAAAAAAAAAAVPLHGPQPLLQPHPAAAVPVHPHLAMPVAVPVPAVAAAAPGGGGVGVDGAGGPAVHQPHPFAEVAAGGAVGGGGAVGVPVAFGAGAGAPPPPMFQHHQHHQHQHQQPEPFWGGGHDGGVMG